MTPIQASNGPSQLPSFPEIGAPPSLEKPKPSPALFKSDRKITQTSHDRDFVKSLGLLWRTPQGASPGTLDTINELQEAFRNNSGGEIVWEASRILGEAHSQALRGGQGLPAGVERQIMTAAYARAFDELKGELEAAIQGPEFDSWFRSANCLAKEAFRSSGDASALSQRTGALEILRRDFVRNGVESLLVLRGKKLSFEYLEALNENLPDLLAHSNKLSKSDRATLGPKLKILAADIAVITAMASLFTFFGFDIPNRLTSELVNSQPEEGCAAKSKPKAPPAP